MQQSPRRRRNRFIKEKRHDVYRENDKRQAPTMCARCGAIFNNGRWTWDKKSKGARKTLCPACRRISDRCPAGEIELKGPFFKDHRKEILNLVHNVAKKETAAHPLERIITVNVNGDHATVVTTGVHVARRIAAAISRSYHGDLSVRYPDGEKSVRVRWERASAH